MAAKKRGLGERGLGALLQGSKVNLNQETSDHDGELREIPVDLIQRGRYQPRRDMDPAGDTSSVPVVGVPWLGFVCRTHPPNRVTREGR